MKMMRTQREINKINPRFQPLVLLRAEKLQVIRVSGMSLSEKNFLTRGLWLMVGLLQARDRVPQLNLL